MSTPPLIVHVVFRLDYGGLENGLVNLVNACAGAGARHAIVALTEATAFKGRVQESVPVYEIGKRPGKDFRAYFRLYKLFRRLRPSIVHTRNIGTLDCALVALLARVPVRIHGEHGWDVHDPDGTSSKYRWMRRILFPLVHRIVTVTEDLRRWLIDSVGVPEGKVLVIRNGVDTVKFRPAESEASGPRAERERSEELVIGSVTRFSAIKDPLNLVEAFVLVAARRAADDPPLRLVMVGDGELRERAIERLEQAGLAAAAWLPGSRDDVPALLRELDLFVLGSLREGMSNTVLEAMASGLPVVATDTGGNRELVEPGRTGALIPPGDSAALAEAIERYVSEPELIVLHGREARAQAVQRFSIAAMVAGYRALYEGVLAERRVLIRDRQPSP